MYVLTFVTKRIAINDENTGRRSRNLEASLLYVDTTSVATCASATEVRVNLNSDVLDRIHERIREDRATVFRTS